MSAYSGCQTMRGAATNSTGRCIIGKPKAPKAPDPKETAAASTSTNVGTAIANAYLGNVNQITPDGSLTYSQTGTHQWKDPYTGKTYDVPTFTAEQKLSEQQQAIKNQTDGAELNLAGLANQQSGMLKDYMSKPFEYNNQDVENWAYDLGSQRLDPRMAKEEEALRSRLLNSGVREGSDAWNSEMSRMGQNKNDAYNQLMLQGRSQAMQEALATRNQPINEITALLSGSQVSQPNFVNSNMPTIPTTDTAGIINQNYQNQMAAYQQKQAGLGGLFSGIGSLAGGLIGLSDDKTKKNKKRHGDVDGEMGLWSFNYKDEPAGTPKHVGLMASEVQKEKPSAVIKKNGVRYVDYGKALGLMGV